MFGDTLALTVATVEKTLVKINQDGYSSEYLLKETLSEFRVKIRHTKTNPRNGTPHDRHNVEITETVYATDTADEFQRKAYFVIEQTPNDLSTSLTQAMVDWAIDGNLDKLMQWES